MSQLSLLGISGSLRAQSFNRMLLNESARLMGKVRYGAADLDLPLYNGDVAEAAGIPAAVQLLAEQIASADMVVIATPEYNQSFSGVLKNALDWVSVCEGNPWRTKPVAIISAAAGRAGGARAQFALRLAMIPFRARLLPGPEVMVAAAQTEFDESGQLTGALYLKLLTELMGDLRMEATRS